MPEITLESLAYGGDAVGHLEGKVVFVPLGVPGDRVLVDIVREHASYARGMIVSVLAPGPGRRSPPCPLFGDCGGCHWQQMEYPLQARGKEEVFSTVIGREVDQLQPICMAPEELGYRRRIRMHWQRGSKGVVMGYYRRGSRDLLDVRSCPLLVDALQEAIEVCREGLGQLPEGEGTLAAVAGPDGSVHACIRTRADRSRAGRSTPLDEVARSVLKDPVAGVEVGRGRQIFHSGAKSIRLNALQASSTAFVQANAAQDHQLQLIVAEWSAASGERVLELFAGVGNLTLVLASLATRVVAVESSPVATALLRQNCRGCGGRIKVCRQDAAAAVDRLCGEGQEFDLVVLNPPREGCKQVAAGLARTGARRVIYVSCDPMTLRRDLSLLARQGYRPLRARALDMMPQTFHVEGIVLLQRDG